MNWLLDEVDFNTDFKVAKLESWKFDSEDVEDAELDSEEILSSGDAEVDEADDISFCPFMLFTCGMLSSLARFEKVPLDWK